jgi:type III restriction enzyme
VVLDSDWEAELARVLESHPKVRAYVKNQGMQFEVPYRDGAVPRKYVTDFIVQVDDSHDDPLNPGGFRIQSPLSTLANGRARIAPSVL